MSMLIMTYTNVQIVRQDDINLGYVHSNVSKLIYYRGDIFLITLTISKFIPNDSCDLLSGLMMILTDRVY